MASICFCSKSSNINEKLAGAVQFFRNAVAFGPAADEQMLRDKNSCFIHAYLEIISHLNPSLYGETLPRGGSDELLTWKCKCCLLNVLKLISPCCLPGSGSLRGVSWV